jgi:hypothetical protein
MVHALSIWLGTTSLWPADRARYFRSLGLTGRAMLGPRSSKMTHCGRALSESIRWPPFRLRRGAAA